MKIFYSWQKDRPNASNRGFIEQALENVAQKLRNDRTLDIEPNIDRDTVGVPGSPEIVSTIFSKIEQADIFVCDISIINGANSKRPTPNPNVLVELGYALKALGENRLILILNSAYGEVEKLPFDLRSRRVLTYFTPAITNDRATERRKLEVSLEQAIRAIHPRLSLSPEYIKAFQFESERVKQLAYEQPKRWEHLLTVELLTHKIQHIREQYNEIGLQYVKTTKASNKDYFKFIQEKNIDIRKINTILIRFPDNITSAWGPKGKPGNALEIKKATDGLVLACEAILDWERDIDFVEPPKLFTNLRDILRGCTIKMISEVERCINELKKIVEQPNLKGTFEITLTTSLPEKWGEKFSAELNHISKLTTENYDLWKYE